MNLAHLAEGHDPGTTALVAGSERWTYGQVNAGVAALRAHLDTAGLAPGDRLSTVLPNGVAFVLTWLAALGLGVAVAPLDPASPRAELGRQLALLRPDATVGPGGDFQGEQLLEIAASASAPPRTGDSRGGRAPAPPIVELDDTAPAALLSTAGTAGAPKVAVLTHGNLAANVAQVGRVPGLAPRAGEHCLGALPMHHVFGLNVVLDAALGAGAAVVLSEHFDPSALLDALAGGEIQVLAGVPAMFAALAERPHGVLRPPRLAISGGASLPRAVAEAFAALVGVPLLEGYGLTEASPTVTSPAPGEPLPPGSVGRPLPGVELRVVDGDGEDAEAGDPGEVWVRGPNVFPGYLDDPDATRLALDEHGWLRTGDVAATDEDGHVFLLDRQKDVVIVSGFNVWPAEVEAVLAAVPGVAEAAVAGRPHPLTGETVHAWVVPEAGAALEPASVIAYCREHLARYKCPTEVAVAAELPHGPAGKLLRRSLP